ncbi:LOW QUALITY PROTEIN: autotransporter secretion outer membrane protein TamA [Zymomonas mobilis]|uniref:Autotransporter secretion outer membrane protein TamA n=1 Tax=Zymomonas mobilis TaxID=542 RepID=A0A542W062_ZYMMB|nr:LOW QUALITY PROTEIN: autotransporter secretion outer membrane protein TamA [Zymomonas mobilis]
MLFFHRPFFSTSKEAACFRKKLQKYAASWLIAATAFLVYIEPVKAKSPPEKTAPTDNNKSFSMAPLDNWFDLGVEWPDLNKTDSSSETVTSPDNGLSTASNKKQNSPIAVAAQKKSSVSESNLGYHYTVKIIGLPPREHIWQTSFNGLSTLYSTRRKRANIAQIRRRIRDDSENLTALLQAGGYYDASVESQLTPIIEKHKIVIQFSVKAGQLYRFADIKINGLEKEDTPKLGLQKIYPLHKDDPVDQGAIISADQQLEKELGHQGFPFAQLSPPDVVVDHQTHSGSLVMNVDTGKPQKFGEIILNSNGQALDTHHLNEIARFHPGTPYDSVLIDDLRRAVVQTSLVSTIQLKPVADPNHPNVTNIVVTTEKAPLHTIAGTVGYGNGEGVRSDVSWTHRNMIKPEGAVTFSGTLGTRDQGVGASLRQGNKGARDRILSSSLSVVHTKRRAYDARTATLSGRFERETNIIWQKKWVWSVGGQFIASDERDNGYYSYGAGHHQYLIAALPGELGYDSSDNLLNPTKGVRISAHASPEISFLHKTVPYIRTQIDASGYQPLGHNIVLAGRVRMGSIVGSDSSDLAPSRRYYVGGGGSVRGFSYQAIGHLNQNREPLGGSSLAEFSIETRFRFGDLGLVPFLDAGNLYTSTLPQMSGLRLGTGLGLRYYTSFGPMRVDLGTPLHRRPGENRIGVYVSLGQAF